MSKKVNGEGPSGEPMNGHALYDYEINSLIGRLLTLVESLGLRESQESAFKDLVRQEAFKLFQCQGVRGDLLNKAIEATIESKYYLHSSAY
jgi:hypothetical protein